MARPERKIAMWWWGKRSAAQLLRDTRTYEESAFRGCPASIADAGLLIARSTRCKDSVAGCSSECHPYSAKSIRAQFTFRSRLRKSSRHRDMISMVKIWLGRPGMPARRLIEIKS